MFRNQPRRQQPRHDAVPHGVYFCKEHTNFYDHTGKGMGNGFFRMWFARRGEFPTSLAAIQPMMDERRY